MGFTNIDGRLLKKMIVAGANNLNKNKQMVDELNVFPVPDGDTGTNMSLTVLSAAKEVMKTDTDNIYAVAKAAANGSLRGARGNSGVILSQLFRGFSKGLEGCQTANIDNIAKAFKKAVETAYKAVMKPKEGTMLTVAKAGVEKAFQLLNEIDDLELLLKEVIKYSNEILNKTPDMLPVLKQAGVVDAGGKGLLCILEGAFDSIYKEEVELDEPNQSEPINFSALSTISEENITFGYCTEFFINVKNADNSIIENLKKYLNTMGDSVVVVNDEEIIKIHIHSDNPGAVLEKAITIGSLSNIKIDNMREQHTSKIGLNEPKPIIDTQQQTKEIAFISIAMGKGISELFHSLGVDIVIEGGQTMNPSTEDILAAIEALNADNILILPNNKNIILAAKQASKLVKDKNIIVLSSKTIPQGISAMISYDENKSILEATEIMEKAISQVKTGQITFAVRDTSINDIEIKEGNILGIIEDNIEVVHDNLEEATKEVIDKLVNNESEIISIYYGEEITEEDVNKIETYILEKYSNCDIEIYNGEQPLYYFIISVE